jgi:hypothetical protein
MKWFLPWLVRWARRAGTRDVCPALAALVSPLPTKYYFPHRTTLHLGRQSCWVACLCVSGGTVIYILLFVTMGMLSTIIKLHSTFSSS